MIPLKYTLRSLRARWVGSLMTVLGTALVVWASVLAFGLAAGLDHTLEVSGDPLDVLAMRKGATSETNSVITEEVARQLATLSDIATDADGNRLCSEELVVVVNAPRREGGGNANVILRGVAPASRALRPAFKIVEGRDMRPGVREAVASSNIARRFVGAGLGEDLDVVGSKFRIVGIFDAGQSATDSEVWTDVKVLGQASKRGGYFSSVQMRATSPEAQKRLIDRIENDEQFALKAITEREYYADQAAAGLAIKFVGRAIAFFLTIGAMFAVANTMFGAVASRAREIGTLRAIGFSRRTILASFLIESLVLCLAGGVIGCLGTLPLNGLSTGTANWATFSEITFAFRFSAMVLVEALLLAVLMGLLGGLYPAVRATRMKIVDALREI
jgi:putative ABC transport system permease protein